MSRMDDEQLLHLLQTEEDEASAYVYGQLGAERDQSMREYNRMPYGNEEDGWSQIVTSDVQDTVEWILPSLLKIFTSTDQAVSFDPSTEQDVEGAEQATDTCNYVFYKQNNGFLTLYTAFKDALIVRNCAVMWRKEDVESVSSVPFQGASAEVLTMMLQEGGEIVEANPSMVQDEMGMPVEVFDGRIRRKEKKTVIKVESFHPDNLLIERDWTSPLLQDCPYVCRVMEVSLSDLKMMGFEVDAKELSGSEIYNDTASYYNGSRTSQNFDTNETEEDEAMSKGWLRIEYVRVDYDGDGIAELRCVYRLKDRILKNEECSHIQIATASPILNTHRWDGMSMSDAVSDLQKLHTELLRQTLNSAYLANNPRKKVLTDSNWSPMANIDDLLDSRIGGIVRVRSMDAVTEEITPFVAGATMPLLEYVASLRENRTGVTRYNQGIDANSLNKTASGVNQIMSASQQRIELIARVMAETLVKPIFQGILKLLTDGGMEKLSFRLRDKFVQIDPNTWRDWYDMTINVGLGTGDKNQQLMHLQQIGQNQAMAAQAGLKQLVGPKQLYNTQAKLVENAGFKNVSDFWLDPDMQQQQAPEQPRVDPLVQAEQVKAQAEQQKFMATQQAEQQKFIAQTQLDQQNQALEFEQKQQLEAMRIQSTERIKAAEIEANKEAKLMELAAGIISSQVQGEPNSDDSTKLDQGGASDPSLQNMQMLMQSIQGMAAAMSAPKTVVRDESGRVVGVQSVIQ